MTACSQELKLVKETSIDVSSFLKNGVCATCVYPISAKDEVTDNAFLLMYGTKKIYKYSSKKKMFIDSIAVALKDAERIIPFYVSAENNVLAFVKERFSLAKFSNKHPVEEYSLTGLPSKDEYNTGYFVLSSYVSKDEKIYLNNLRIHNQKTADTYFENMAVLPLVGRFETRDKTVYYQPVNFITPLPETKQLRLPSNITLFDVDEKRDYLYFQNRCVDTIYRLNLKNDKLTKIIPVGSQYIIKPTWYNPDSVYQEDALLNQSMVGGFFIDAKQKMILRQISVNLKDGARFVLQALDFDGKLLHEQILDPKFAGLKRHGDEVLIFARNGNNIEFYKPQLK